MVSPVPNITNRDEQKDSRKLHSYKKSLTLKVMRRETTSVQMTFANPLHSKTKGHVLSEKDSET